MSDRSISVDHDEIAGFVTRLRALADGIESTITTGTAQIMADLTAEASQATTTGQPAPIFADVITSMDKAMGALQTNATQLVANLRSDADFLENASAAMRQVDDDGAAAVAAVETQLSPTGGPTDRWWDTPPSIPIEPPWTGHDEPSRAVPLDPEVQQRDRMEGGKSAPSQVHGSPVDLPRYNI
ncbi:MAG: hypothetical protein KC933_32860 [Myxococcales bacterium]|nr:hypothetical protein [Myxococcales bacterium]